MNINIKKLHPDAILPHLACGGDVGFDLYATETITLKPGKKGQVPTGLAFEIPIGYAMLIWDKSGISHKEGIKTLGGVIDSGYRGEIIVGVINLGTQEYTFQKGHKVAQFLIQKVELPQFKEVIEVSNTVRNKNGFGSTGK